MTPVATQRVRRATSLAAVGWALLALVLSVTGQLRVQPGADPPLRTSHLGRMAIVSSVSAEARQAGVKLGDRVIAVDGMPIDTWYWQRGWSQLRTGKPVVYRIESMDGAVRDLELQPMPRTASYERLLIPIFAALVIVGFAFLGLGAFVWRLKPDRSESWAFLLFSSLMATSLFGAVQTYDAPLGYERMMITVPFLGAAMFHLFTVFPMEPSWVARNHRLRWLPYLGASCIALLVAFERVSGRPIAFLPTLAFVFAFVASFASIAILLVERFRRRGGEETRNADIVIAGVALSFLPVVGLLVAQQFSPVSVPISAAMIWFVFFPAAVAFGIVRGQLFDAQNLSSSSAAYGAATLAITGLFAALITLADAAFRRFQLDASSPWFSVSFLFLAILAFNPLRDRLQVMVDRLFDRDRAGYRSAVREISEAMVSMLSLNEIGERLLLAVTETMNVERAMFLLMQEGERRLRPAAWRGEWEDEQRDVEIPADHPIAKQLWMRRQELARSDFDETTDPETREICRDVFDLLDVRLLVPILFGVDLLGVIAVGAKSSGDLPGPDDRQLLRTLANQSAIAIENAQAFDEIAQLNETLERRVEERTRELQLTQAQLMQSEKMRSLGQLVAGVAHELNNPIGFVHANLQLLDDYVRKMVSAQLSGGDAAKPREAIRKLLARSREGTERVKRIVLDLRTFSRMDQAELADADLNEELGRTLGLMEPRLKGVVRVERELTPLPPVRCYPAQLNQVFMNLLMNAADAVGERGTLRITSRRSGDGVELCFCDDGPGIPPALRERIFEPFFTTKPVGQGTGLGLSISHGIVERHGGRLSVECPPGGGTTFRIELPLVAAPPGDDASRAA